MVPTIQIYNQEAVKKVSEYDEEFILPDEHQTEKVIWTARPSKIRFIWTYLVCLLSFWLVAPLFVMLCLHIHNGTIKYVLTNERLRICSGLFIRRIVDLELYRVKDISIVIPFYLRMFGYGSLEVRTSDPGTPYIFIEAIPHISRLEETMRHYVEKRRDEKKVQEIDQYRYQ